MEISQIRSAMPFLFPSADKDGALTAPKASGDTVNIQGMQLLADEDVEGVFNDTLGMIAGDPTHALSVHSGLNESRVFALLGM